MDSNHPTSADQDFRDKAILLAFEQCLREFGVKGALGCAHLAVDAARALLAERNKEDAQ